jgi:hypothetical protein
MAFDVEAVVSSYMEPLPTDSSHMEGIAAKVCDIVPSEEQSFDPPKVEDRIIPVTLNFITSVWSSIKEIPDAVACSPTTIWFRWSASRLPRKTSYRKSAATKLRLRSARTWTRTRRLALPHAGTILDTGQLCQGARR